VPALRESHLERWRGLIEARREQMDRQQAALGGPPDDWWAGRASHFTRGLGDPAALPPHGLPQIIDRLERRDTVLDVGAGAGRYSVPLSRVVRHITMVEPSPAMATLAREQMELAGRDNWTLIEREWMDAKIEPADAVLLANVLNPHADLEGWVDQAIAHARRWLFIVHGAMFDGSGVLDRVARAFHGEPRVPQPSLADLLPALHELGVYPDVIVIPRRFRHLAESRAEAVREIAATALVEDTPEARRRIGRIVTRDLVTLDDGRVIVSDVTVPGALLAWRVEDKPNGRWQP
jgi:SAM-dependent methyltransferase